ncbi:MAG: chloride channel protein, partial [Chloroflexia bacterium]
MLTLQRLRQMETAFLAASAVLVGASTALGSYLFHLGIEHGLVGEGVRAVVRVGSRHEWVLFSHAPSDGRWGYLLAIAFPALGLVVAGGLVRLLCPRETGHGVAGIIEAVALRGGRLRVQPAVARVVAAMVTIASGGSVGPEDPNVQIGATVGSWFAQRLRLPSERVRTLAACGAASGIASAFNAPIAGVFFAQEIILGEFTTGGFGMVVLAAVTASVITRVLRGDSPAFRIPEYTLRSPWELFLYLGLGLTTALASTLYVRELFAVEERFHAWRAPFWLKAAVGGGLVGLVGIAFPQLFGVGYETMDGLLRGEVVATWVLVALMFLKPLLTATTLAAGGSGGVFAPSLFIGAMLGGAFGQAVGKVLPDLVGPPPAYALVGMGGVLAGAVHCPITAILLLFEMTRDYRIILPMMLCAVVSTLVSQRLNPGSVYTARLAKRGIYLQEGR